MEFLLWKAMLAIFKWSENDRWSWLWVIVDTFPPDFQTMMVSDCRSWFGKMIVSDHRSRKKGSSPTRPLHYLSTYLLFWILNISHCLSFLLIHFRQVFKVDQSRCHVLSVTIIRGRGITRGRLKDWCKCFRFWKLL